MKRTFIKSLAILLLAIFELGCTAVGHNIDKKFDVPEPRAKPGVPLDHNKYNYSQSRPFTEMGAEVDTEIFKELLTRRKENDMAWRDEYPVCPEGEIRACSITSGCGCKSKK